MITANSKIEKVTVEATIIRADGTRIPLGIICESKPESKIKKFIKKIGGK